MFSLVFFSLQWQIVAANKNISLNASYIPFEYVFNQWQQKQKYCISLKSEDLIKPYITNHKTI